MVQQVNELYEKEYLIARLGRLSFLRTENASHTLMLSNWNPSSCRH